MRFDSILPTHVISFRMKNSVQEYNFLEIPQIKTNRPN